MGNEDLRYIERLGAFRQVGVEELGLREAP